MAGYLAVLVLSILGWMSPRGLAMVAHSQSTIADASTATDSSGWSLEGLLQAHSVAGPSSPWLGASAAYRFLSAYQVGFRGCVPLSRTVDKSTYSIQAYLRARLSQGAHTSLFVEPEVAENFYNFVPFESYGLSLGASHALQSGLSVGVLAGLETARDVIDSVGVEKRNDFVIYPKIGLIADFGF